MPSLLTVQIHSLVSLVSFCSYEDFMSNVGEVVGKKRFALHVVTLKL
jgi:hypothetical protein